MPRARYEWKVVQPQGDPEALRKLLEELDVQRYEVLAILADRTVVARRAAPPEELQITFVPTEE